MTALWRVPSAKAASCSIWYAAGSPARRGKPAAVLPSPTAPWHAPQAAAAAGVACAAATCPIEATSASSAAAKGASVRRANIRFESITLEDRESLRRTDEIEPFPRSLDVRCAAHQRARIDADGVVGLGNVDMRDRMSDLLLKHRLGSPGDPRLGPALHEPQRRLPVMDAGEARRPIAHLRAVNRLHQRGAAGLLERGADLAGHALELGIRHGEADAGLAEIGESSDVRGVVPRYHDSQRVGHVWHRRLREQARGDLGLHRLEAREVYVGLDRPGHVADRHPTAGADLAL